MEEVLWWWSSCGGGGPVVKILWRRRSCGGDPVDEEALWWMRMSFALTDCGCRSVNTWSLVDRDTPVQPKYSGPAP